MKKTLLTLLLLLSVSCYLFSQGAGIGTVHPHSSAILDITHTGKGLLIPRMNTVSIQAIAAPACGLMVYDSLKHQLMVNMGTPGEPEWQTITYKSSWGLGGNNGVNPATQFIGTTDNRPLRFRVNGIRAGELSPGTGSIFWGLRAGDYNTTGYSNIAIGTDALNRNSTRSNLVAIGDSALYNNGVGATYYYESLYNTAVGSKSLFANTTGSANTAVGYESLKFNTTGYNNSATGSHALYANTTGINNTATGFTALSANTTGNRNTATGQGALTSNSTGSDNTAAGDASLYYNTTGSGNTAAGGGSLYSNTVGYNNTASGYQTLFSNTTGYRNTATGYQSLLSNTTGYYNTAAGFQSLYSNTTGSFNSATGYGSLYLNTTGNYNTASGFQSLYSNDGYANTSYGYAALSHNTTGSYNTAVGAESLRLPASSYYNTAVGYQAAGSSYLGYNNTFIGSLTNSTVNDVYNSVALGNSATVSGSNQVRLGNISTVSIGGYVGFSNISDGRYKKNIREEVKGLDFIMKLKLVTYQLDITGLNAKLNTWAGRENEPGVKVSVTEKEKTVFSGFIAQEVEQAAKDAGYDFSGVDKPQNENDLYSLRYAEFVVPLVKAIQEQQRMIVELKKQNEELKKANADYNNVTENLLHRLQKLESLFSARKVNYD